jgi:hypothetical protein
MLLEIACERATVHYDDSILQQLVLRVVQKIRRDSLVTWVKQIETDYLERWIPVLRQFIEPVLRNAQLLENKPRA